MPSTCTCAGTAPGYPQHEDHCGRVFNCPACGEDFDTDEPCGCDALRNSLEACRNAGESIRDERDEAVRLWKQAANCVIGLQDDNAQLVRERDAALACIAEVQARATFESTALNESYRRGFNNAMSQIRAVLAASATPTGPEPERQTCSHGYSPHCYPMCVDVPATPEPTDA